MGAYSYQSGNGKVCYALSVPTQKAPANVDHGDNFFLVSQKPGQNVSFEPQFMAGYELNPNAKVIVTIGNRQLRPCSSTANPAGWKMRPEEPQLVAAMRGGARHERCRHSRRRGTKTSYTYSLKGISAALAAIQKMQIIQKIRQNFKAGLRARLFLLRPSRNLARHARFHAG